MWSYYNWIRNQVAANTPWDQFAREVVTATGSTLENGAASFFVLHDDPPEMAETGHAHVPRACRSTAPSATTIRWRSGPTTSTTAWPTCSRACGPRTVPASGIDRLRRAEGELVQPLHRQAAAAAAARRRRAAVDGSRATAAACAGRLARARRRTRTSPGRSPTASGPTSSASGWSRRSTTCARPTRRATRSCWHALAEYLVEQKYDLKALMRAILQSETYQRSSKPLPGNAGDQRFYTRYYPRRLMAEVLLDALSQVTRRAPTSFAGLPGRLAGAAAARRERRLLLPRSLRPARARG